MRIFVVTLFFIVTNILAQSYYSGTEGLYGENLKSVLFHKIKDHTRYPFTSSSTDVWDLLKETDKDPNNSDNVILIYTGRSVNAAQEYNNGQGWNREHVWAKSHGFPNSGDTAYTDIHHLRPADISTNSDRGNLDFDEGGNQHYDDGVFTGNYYDDDSWEPRDDVKGDIARMLLYMTVRYEYSGTYDLELVESIPTATGSENFGRKSVLLKWNRIDPPDDFEKNRNEVIYNYQNNRNPFIDHPEFADRIYNAGSLIVETTEAISNTEVVVVFSKEVEETSAKNVNNYLISDGIGHPTGASFPYNGDYRKVLLEVSPLSGGKTYYVRVSNIVTSAKEQIIDNSISAIETDSSVPVQLQFFTANVNKSKVTLCWQTATEVNNYGFEIQRSAVSNQRSDEFETIGFVKGAGNSNSPKEYSFTDNVINGGKYSYRLKQIDLDGTYKYSNIVEVNVGAPAKFELMQNYPNPFNPTTTIKYSIPSIGDVETQNLASLRIYNILGEEVATLVNKKQSPGNYTVQFDASNLPSGVYFYTLRVGDFVATKKMLLLK